MIQGHHSPSGNSRTSDHAGGPQAEAAPSAARRAVCSGAPCPPPPSRQDAPGYSTPAYMHAATARPPRLAGFSLVSQAEVEIWFRAPAGRVPDVLEIGLHGRRRPRVEAYWDGCRIAL